MSAARLCTTRLASLIALAALALFAGCTTPTPLYCATQGDCDKMGPGLTCMKEVHTCYATAVDADAGDAGAAGGSAGAAGDAGVDKPTDGGIGEDHPANTDGGDGPRSDASDASADVFHPCVNNLGCPDSTKPACQVDAGVCVGCVQNSDCKAAGAHACDTAVNKCVECVANADCTIPTKPICDHQTCRGCKVDSECAGIGPGVCMSHLDGHCATDSETVYVSKTGCADTADGGTVLGTSTLPYCTSQAAIDSTALPAAQSPDAGVPDGGNLDAATKTDAGSSVLPSPRSLVVMRGPFLTEWSFNSARTLTVVGQANATITPGGHIGIHVSAGTVYARSLHVAGGGSSMQGIVADGGELHIDRCIVENTGMGGVQIDNAGFEITNTVLANNGTNTFTGSVLWSGALLGMVPAGKPAIFLNNTVINNVGPGVSCTGNNSHDIAGSVVTGNHPDANQTLGCNLLACCGTGSVSVDPATYHLMAGSSCIDRLTADMSTAYDFDGTPRPSGSMSDCGAFEYVAP